MTSRKDESHCYNEFHVFFFRDSEFKFNELNYLQVKTKEIGCILRSRFLMVELLL